MPLLLLIPLATLAFGGGVYLAGSGTQKIVNSATQAAIVGGALYLGYVALAHGK